MKLAAPYLLCSLLMLLAVPVLAQTEQPAQVDARPAWFIGTVINVKTRKPASDVVVIATSPVIYGERSAMTDELGNFRLNHLPPGTYTLRFEHPDYATYQRADILLRPSRTVRVQVELLEQPATPESLAVQK